MGALNLPEKIVERYLAKKAAEAAERAAVKATAAPEVVAKMMKEDTHAAANAANERRIIDPDNSEFQARENAWTEKRANANLERAKEFAGEKEARRPIVEKVYGTPREVPPLTKEQQSAEDWHRYKLEKYMESIEEHERNPSRISKARAALEKENEAEKARRIESGIIDEEGTKVISNATEERPKITIQHGDAHTSATGNQSKAQKILDKVDTDEKATALKGADRQEYLNALDEVYGAKDKRAKDLGFGAKADFYHGSNADIKSFDHNAAKVRNTINGPGSELGSFFSSSPDSAASYAPNGQVYKVKINRRETSAIDEGGSTFGFEEAEQARERLKTDKNVTVKNVYDSPDTSLPKSDIVIVKDPSSIRSTNAAFDPRFKNSSKIMAGVGVGGAAVSAPSENPYDPVAIAKKGYDNFGKPIVNAALDKYAKFEKARQSVVGKIVNLTDMTADNPHVPQYAKDIYNKAADAVVNNALDPLNAIPGAGAVDAAAGAGSAAYDMYTSSRKPTSTAVDSKPMTNPAQKVNWPR